MLKEISCDKFSNNPIIFNESFNVILGDSVATNSIGKSSFLMVIDFAMGGDSFTKYNTDVPEELGHHYYYFKFLFQGKIHIFRRGTHRPEIVNRCNDKFEDIDTIDIDDYRAFLKTAYGLEDLDLSFRGIVSLFSRIWGKENLEPKRPLDGHKQQSANDTLISILKLYGLYSTLQNLAADLVKKKSDKSALSSALKRSFIPKINKSKYKSNLSLISHINSEFEDIKRELATYATSMIKIASRQIADLKEAKDTLFRSKLLVDSRLARIKSSLSQNHPIKGKSFDLLKNFFPNVLEEKILQVEEFHSEIAVILRRELKSSEKELLAERDSVNSEIAKIDASLALILVDVENPGLIVDRVYDLSNTRKSAELENQYHDQEVELALQVKEIQQQLTIDRKKLLTQIEVKLNTELQKLSLRIYGAEKKSPYLTFTDSNYDFQIFEDTGTGKAYSNLILFDLAIFHTSRVPFLIHDSLLFKNIENQAVAKIVELYAASPKQTFIAIDEVQKYGEKAAQSMHDAAVLELSNTKVLYIKDWRK